MKSLIISTMTVAGAEIGDKTQLLALMLASRFKKPVPIILGIFVATLISHTIAALLGEWVGMHLTGTLLHSLLAIAYIAAAIWMLIPDKCDDDTNTFYSSSIFVATMIAFFIAEIADKTQIVTAILAAQFQTIIFVVLGSTMGMLIANVPAVLLGHKATQFVSIKFVKLFSVGLFIFLGVLELFKLITS